MTANPSVTGADYTPTEAARLCGCSVDTIRRYREAGRFPTAFRHGAHMNAAWRIPVGDLVTAGLFTPADVPTFDTTMPTSGPTTGPPPRPAPDIDGRLVEATRTIDYLVESNRRLLGLVEALTAPTAEVQTLGSVA
jgi:hypothetical protein